MTDVLAGNSVDTPPMTVQSTVPITPTPSAASPPNPTDIPTPGVLPVGASALAGTGTGLNGTFAQKMAQAADKLGIPANEPGGWAKSLLASAQKALAGEGTNPGPFTGLGDIGKVPSGAGALYGIGKVMAARQAATQAAQDRQTKQHQQDFENQIATNADQRADARDKLLNDYTNAQMVHEQALTHQLGEEAVDKAITEGQANIKLATSGEEAEPVYMQKQTAADMKKLLQQGRLTGDFDGNQLRSDRYVAYPDGKIEGPDGPTTTYTILDAGKPVKLDEATAKKWNDAFPNQNFTKDTVIDGPTFHFNAQQVANAQAQTAARDKTLLDNKIATQKDVDELGAMNLPFPWVNAMSSNKQNEHKALNALLSKPDIIKQYPDLEKNVIQAYGGPEKWADLGLKRDEDAEKAAKDAADKKASQDALNDQQIPMTPEEAAKISQLPKPQQDLLSKFSSPTQAALYEAAFGHDDAYRIYNNRIRKGEEGLSMQNAMGIMHMLNPKFDPSQAPSYQKTRNTFEAQEMANKLNSLNVSFEHLQDANDANGILSATPIIKGVAGYEGNQSVADLQTAITNASEEIANAYSASGKATKEEIANHRKDLEGNSAAQQKAMVHSQAHDLIKRANELWQQWAQGSVPGSPPPKEILSENAVKGIASIDPNLLKEVDPDLLKQIPPPDRPGNVPADAVWNPQNRTWSK